MGKRHPLILLLSNALDATTDFVEERLRAAGVEHVRLDTDRLASTPVSFRLDRKGNSGCFGAADHCVAVENIGAIYYRRPQPPPLPQELEPALRPWVESELRRTWGGLLASNPNIKWVNHPLSISAASYKPEQLARASRFGLSVPETLITTDADLARQFCERLRWQVVVKPIGHGEIRGPSEAEDRVVYTNPISESQSALLERVAFCPTLFQRWITKDVDVRVTVAGGTCIAVALHSQERPVSVIDCRRDNMSGMRYSLLSIPDELERILLTLVRSYELHFAAIDLARDLDGRYWFFELNPAGQWAWLEQITGAPISEALIRCLLDD